MDRVEKKKRFKHPRTYYAEFVLFGLFIIVGLFLIWDSFAMSEERFYYFATRELTGTAEARRAQLMMMFAAKHFGREGLLVLAILLTILFSYGLIKEIRAYRRYKHKCRLYHEGVIKNFYDIYDDYVPLLSWRRLKMLFDKDKKTEKQKKYPSNRQMKKQIKELKEQYRKM